MLQTVCSHAAITLAHARMYQRLEMIASTDGLTGLTNRRRFVELLHEVYLRAERFKRKMTLLMIDADHFKIINDTYGHPVGDLVLKRLAGLLQEEARRTDVVARYGGEEFVLLLEETDAEGALLVAERIRDRVSHQVVQGDFGSVKITVSLGIATWPDNGRTAEEVLKNADQALYQAKRQGRNRVVMSTRRCLEESATIGLQPEQFPLSQAQN